MSVCVLKRRLHVVGIFDIPVVLVTAIIGHIDIAAHLSPNAVRFDADADADAKRRQSTVANVYFQQFVWHECATIRHGDDVHA